MKQYLLCPPPRRWVCRSCPAAEVTAWNVPNRFHACPALGGLTAPLVLEGSAARVRVAVREDYVGRELVQYDGAGRPVSAVVTERPDGSNDLMVLAPTARAEGN